MTRKKPKPMGKPPGHTQIRVTEDGRIVAPIGECAKVVGLSRPALYKWESLTKVGGARYLDEVVAERIRRLEEKLEGVGDDSLAHHRLREQRARADKLELEAAELARELVRVTDVTQTLDRVFAVVQSRVLQVAHVAAARLAGAEPKKIRRELDTLLREALVELADLDLGETSASTEEGDEGEAA